MPYISVRPRPAGCLSPRAHNPVPLTLWEAPWRPLNSDPDSNNGI